jgi:hypothetical protein
MIPPPPGAEPTAKKAPPLPDPYQGTIWKSDHDWYERNKNKNFIFDADYWKVVIGIFITGVFSATTKITLGWEHKNVLGGTASFIMPWDNKINIGFVLNYLRPVKHETTMTNKTEWILGIKLSQVTGKKTEYTGATKTKVDDIKTAEKTQKLEQHVTAAEKAIATAIEMEIKALEEEHDSVLSKLTNYETVYDTLDQEVDKWTQRADAFQGTMKEYREECESVAEKYSGAFKSLASAAHDINVSGALEKTFKGECKFIAGSLMQLGAALTKAG